MTLAVHRLSAGRPALHGGHTGGVVTIGNFDGLHRGHQALVSRAVAEASRTGVAAILLTFEPHPRRHFRPEQPLFRLTPPPARDRLLRAMAVDAVAVAHFDAAFAALSADEFVAATLCGELDPSAVVVGHDFRYGRDRRGSAASLAAEGAARGFAVHVVEPVTDAEGRAVSSGRVRAALAEGDIAAANALLGYRWFVCGEVGHGDKRGRLLGFPTANIALPAEAALRHGIYAVTLQAEGESPLPAVASFGVRPTFGDNAPLLEVHVFDASPDLYGRRVVVTFHAWLRPEERFAALDQLVAQMGEDAARARTLLASAGPGTPLDGQLAALDPSAAVVAGGSFA